MWCLRGLLTSVATLRPAATPEEGAAQQSNCRRSTITGLLAKCSPRDSSTGPQGQKASYFTSVLQILEDLRILCFNYLSVRHPLEGLAKLQARSTKSSPKVVKPWAVGPQLCNLKDLRKKRIPGRIPGSGKIQVCGEPL